jgi:peptide methionine sulfoxide reductase MsrA
MIAYHSPEQELLAKKSKEDLERSGKLNGRRIVTEIVAASTFYKAEEYHQKYYQKRDGGGSCYI